MIATPAGSSIARSERGFTIVEMMVSIVIMMAVTGAIFSLMDPSQGIFQTQPEVSDMQQRLRVGVESLAKDLAMAGAGTYQGSATGALYNVLAPVMPYRFGGANDDPSNGLFYRSDAISVVYVPSTPAQSTLSTSDLPANTTEIDVTPTATCSDTFSKPCGFQAGMSALLFDQSGNSDVFTVASVQDPTMHIKREGGSTVVAYPKDTSVIAEAYLRTYYLKTDTTTNTYQLMQFDGKQTDSPIVDNVVKLAFEYFGDSLPPQLLPNKTLTGPGPWTTYGPKPPVLGVDNATDAWPAGENCAFQVTNGQQVSRLPTLDATALQVKLDPSILNDGPWCPDETRVERFDADLLRVRRVRVTIRVQTALSSMRGPAGVLFIRGGNASVAQRYVPDQEIRFDVTPRNLNLGR